MQVLRLTNMRMLQSSDIVGSVSTHQRCVAEPFQRRYHKLFLLRSNAGEHFNVRQQLVNHVILGF